MTEKKQPSKFYQWPKRWWVAFLVCVPIAAGGIVFIYFALSKQLIDAESGRYLLSAIAQALAALLAIIFAGVAILWGQESSSIDELIRLRGKTLEFCFSYKYTDKHGKKLKRLQTTLGVLLEDYEKQNADVRSKAKEGIRAMAKLCALEIDVTNEEAISNIQLIEKTMKILGEPLDEKASITNFLLEAQDMLKFYRIKNLWKLIENVVNLIPVFPKPIYSWSTQSRGISLFSPHPVLLYKLQRSLDEAMQFLSRVLIARRARGISFIDLISLYAVTIAGSLIALAAMKGQGICDSQATLIAAGPLLFAIGAVAMTFIYLYNLVKGDRNE